MTLAITITSILALVALGLCCVAGLIERDDVDTSGDTEGGV